MRLGVLLYSGSAARGTGTTGKLDHQCIDGRAWLITGVNALKFLQKLLSCRRQLDEVTPTPTKKKILPMGNVVTQCPQALKGSLDLPLTGYVLDGCNPLWGFEQNYSFVRKLEAVN